MKWLEDLIKTSREKIREDAKKYCVTSTALEHDFVSEKARGALVFDVNGKMFVDFSSSLGWFNAGYNHPVIRNAIKYFLDNDYASMASQAWPNRFSVGLCKKLCEITPGNFPKKVYLDIGGSKAVEDSEKHVIEHRGPNQELFVFENAFHGRTFGALKFHYSKAVHRRDFIHDSERARAIPFPKLGHGCVMYQSTILHPRAEWRAVRPAYFLAELVQGEGGINVGCFTCIPRVIEEFRKEGALIAIDGIQTDFMRTGKMFACEWYGVEPDILILGKSLCPGNHLSAVVVRADLDFKEKARNSLTGVSAENCIAALAAIHVLENLDRTALLRKIHLLSTVVPEGLGMMRKITFPNFAACKAFQARAYEKSPTGLITTPAGTNAIRIMPPVTIEKSELQLGLCILKEILQKSQHSS